MDDTDRFWWEYAHKGNEALLADYGWVTFPWWIRQVNLPKR